MRLVKGLFLGLAAGPGLTGAPGTPSFRGVGTIGWSPADEPDEKDTAAKADRDNDGFADDIDACPDKPGELAGDPTKDGCPPESKPSVDAVTFDEPLAPPPAAVQPPSGE